MMVGSQFSNRVYNLEHVSSVVIEAGLTPRIRLIYPGGIPPVTVAAYRTLEKAQGAMAALCRAVDGGKGFFLFPPDDSEGGEGP